PISADALRARGVRRNASAERRRQPLAAQIVEAVDSAETSTVQRLPDTPVDTITTTPDPDALRPQRTATLLTDAAQRQATDEAMGLVNMTGIMDEHRYLGADLGAVIRRVTGGAYQEINDMIRRYQHWERTGVLDLADTALDGDPDAEAILNRLRDQGFFDEVAERQSSHMIEGSSLNDVPTLSRTDIDELDYDDLEL